MELYALLEQLDIPWHEVSHPAIYTMQEAEQVEIDLPGVEVKNLFLRDKHQYYLYCLPADSRADLKALRQQLGSGALSFARDEALLEKLGVIPGAVTPLGLINNHQRDVTLVIHRQLLGQTIWVHPNLNTKTMSLAMDDLLRLMAYLHVPVQLVPEA